ncbi:nucleolar protein 9-like [Plakobranchus ocellatus]|uniref:Nucleolar protein 9-like n=1 Tax=Plakobranchus ocellatus TaxID=259542 RepID=A0AAV3ZMZ1_9GAST|nr:nucleolar protein 9-like [Plakobranchus ocellatus]
MPKRKFYHVDRHGSTVHNDKKAKIGILSEDVMSYYRNVSSSLENGFDDDQDLKEEFLTNVYNTLRDEGIQVSQNQTVSRILEVLFSHSKPSHMQDLFCLFCRELTVVVFDRFASHVFQALIQYLPAMYDERDKEDNSAWQKSFHENVQTLCGFMESHLRDVMTHTYGSHVLRSFLEALGGVHVKEDVVRSRVSRGQRKDNETTAQREKAMSQALTAAFQSSFKDITDKLVRLCNFEDHLADQNFCPVLQTSMLILHKTAPDQYKVLVDTIIDKTRLFENNEDVGVDDVANRLPDIVQNEVGSYLVELLLSLASESQLQELYNKLFKKRIIYFAVHPIANYILQKMLSCVRQSDMMEELLTDIKPYLEDILAVNHIGIVTKLAEACRRTNTGQEDFLKALMGAFHCLEPEDRQKKVAPLLASLQTYEVFFNPGQNQAETKEGEKPASSMPLLKAVNIHGSLMLQQLLQFQRTQQVASSLVGLTTPELVSLCCDRCGSHIVDIRTVLEKNKVAFLKKLQGSYINIACNRNGSRCLENVWNASALKQKIHIAEDLAKNQERLEGDQWGRFLYRNFALFKFSQRRKEWMDVQAASSKKKQLIKDILEGSSKKSRKKKDKRHENETQPSSVHQVENLDGLDQLEGKASKEIEVVQGKELKSEALSAKNSEGHFSAETENIPHSTEQSKKRKRKKEKKRLVRGEGSDDVTESKEVATFKSGHRIEQTEEGNIVHNKKHKKLKEQEKMVSGTGKLQKTQNVDRKDENQVEESISKKMKRKKKEKDSAAVEAECSVKKKKKKV